MRKSCARIFPVAKDDFPLQSGERRNPVNFGVSTLRRGVRHCIGMAANVGHRIEALQAAVVLLPLTCAPAWATFPYPAPPAGTPPQNYSQYLFLPTTSPPVRPNEFQDS